MNKRLSKSLFHSEETMSETDILSPSQLELLKFATPTSATRIGEHSGRSRRLRSASIAGCRNCKELEMLLEGERHARRSAAINAAEAREKCLDLGAAISKIEHNLYQASEELRRIEEFIDAATEQLDVERSKGPEIITID